MKKNTSIIAYTLLLLSLLLISITTSAQQSSINVGFELVPIIEVDSNNLIQVYYAHSKGKENPISENEYYIISNKEFKQEEFCIETILIKTL